MDKHQYPLSNGNSITGDLQSVLDDLLEKPLVPVSAGEITNDVITDLRKKCYLIRINGSRESCYMLSRKIALLTRFLVNTGRLFSIDELIEAGDDQDALNQLWGESLINKGVTIVDNYKKPAYWYSGEKISRVYPLLDKSQYLAPYIAGKHPFLRIKLSKLVMGNLSITEKAVKKLFIIEERVPALLGKGQHYCIMESVHGSEGVSIYETAVRNGYLELPLSLQLVMNITARSAIRIATLPGHGTFMIITSGFQERAKLPNQHSSVKFTFSSPRNSNYPSQKTSTASTSRGRATRRDHRSDNSLEKEKLSFWQVSILILIIVSVISYLLAKFLLEGSFDTGLTDWGVDLGYTRVLWGISLIVYCISLLVAHSMRNALLPSLKDLYRVLSTRSVFILLTGLLVLHFIAHVPSLNLYNTEFLYLDIWFNKITHFLASAVLMLIAWKLSPRYSTLFIVLLLVSSWELLELLVVSRLGTTNDMDGIKNLLGETRDVLPDLITDVMGMLACLILVRAWGKVKGNNTTGGVTWE